MNRIQLYLSHPHDCSYLDDRKAKTLFLDPHAKLTNALYGELINKGYRRSGDLIYRPSCDDCGQCLSSRVLVAMFQPRRSQRRVLEKWQGVETIVRSSQLEPEHFALYSKYVESRHPAGGMAGVSKQQYLDFMTASWSDTLFVEFRLQEELVALAVTDLLKDGLSAVYTFFDPDYARLSPGVFAILWQIEEARRRQLPYLYLGYLVPDCIKMSYKSEYRPLEIYNLKRERWGPLDGLSAAAPEDLPGNGGKSNG